MTKERKWQWMSYTLRREVSNDARDALFWNTQGTRNRSSLGTQSQMIQMEAAEEGATWNEINALVRNRVGRR